jgi:regulator of replication initiation timing
MESKETKDSEDKEIKEGEMPAGLKKYLDKKDDAKKESKEDDKEKEEGYGKVMSSKHMKKEETEAEKKDEKAEEKEDKKEIDVKEHVDALIAGEDSLSEEFKTKAATVFEAAIKSKVKEIAEEMQADFDKKLTEETSKSKDELVEKVDSYLAYVVEEWMKENELALERGIKGEIAEDFISGLKKLFEDHYIDVPDEKYNVLEDQSSQIEELKKKLNESIEKNVELTKENGNFKRQDIIDEASKDLAETQKEKFNKLAEEIDYKNEEDFKTKVATVKESYFGKKETSSEIDDVAAESNQDNPDLTNAMAAYSAAISKTKDIKLSN